MSNHNIENFYLYTLLYLHNMAPFFVVRLNNPMVSFLSLFFSSRNEHDVQLRKEWTYKIELLLITPEP